MLPPVNRNGMTVIILIRSVLTHHNPSFPGRITGCHVPTGLRVHIFSPTVLYLLTVLRPYNSAYSCVTRRTSQVKILAGGGEKEGRRAHVRDGHHLLSYQVICVLGLSTVRLREFCLSFRTPSFPKPDGAQFKTAYLYVQSLTLPPTPRARAKPLYVLRANEDD